MAFGAKPITNIKPRDYAICTKIMAHVFNQSEYELHGLYNGLTPVDRVKDATHWLGIATKHGQTVVMFGGDKFNIANGQIPHSVNPDGYSFHIEAVVNKRRLILDCVENGFSPEMEKVLCDQYMTNREKETQLVHICANAAQEITTLMRNNLKPLRSFNASVLAGKGKNGQILVTLPDGQALSGFAKYVFKADLQAKYQTANSRAKLIKGWTINDDTQTVESVRKYFAQTDGLPSEIQFEEPVTESLGFLDASNEPATSPQESNGVSQPATTPQATEQGAIVSQTNALVLDRTAITNPDGVVVG